MVKKIGITLIPIGQK